MDAMARWESQTKRIFNGDTGPNKRYPMPARGLQDTPDYGIRNGKFEISGKTVKKLFDRVVDKILKLVTSQIEETKKRKKVAKAVLLAGGFGRNEYLKKRIQETVGLAVKVEKMKDCTTAIVRGALIRGLADKQSNPRLANIWVESRIARKHYGTSALTEYIPGKHSPYRPRIPRGADGGERIEVIQWFIDKGSEIKESKPFSFKYYYDEPVSNVNFQGGRLDNFTMPVYICDHDQRPDYPELGTTGRCKLLVKLIADLNKIPKEARETKIGQDNQLYYKIPFKIEMTCHSANITFNLVHERDNQGTIERVECGSVQAEYK
ncbi:uncharacterized protein BCR38DRAFT_473718 [Pseudomassariella vexata]|uniref:Uncharacterized protein n=1 Tax=Pseudomassariella vexata TaxID=1141098 RepID=A0A1Y2E560_9PEZI|nr:uncharacterized protein BCR38DRAFT_473718 [Pseudomassariella vexata]ORY66494.1 hypothetical protein BCR38DRAFT_473718 [Pseudomassariella vexata]